MSVFIMPAYLVCEQEQQKEKKNKRCALRDQSIHLDFRKSVYVLCALVIKAYILYSLILYYRINKESFKDILKDKKQLVPEMFIPAALELTATLRFLGGGGFQRSIAKDVNFGLGRSAVSKTLLTVLNIFERNINKDFTCTIKFPL